MWTKVQWVRGFEREWKSADNSFQDFCYMVEKEVWLREFYFKRGKEASLHAKGKALEIREKRIQETGENCRCHAFEKVITDRSWGTNGELSRQLLPGHRREDRENTNIKSVQVFLSRTLSSPQILNQPCIPWHVLHAHHFHPHGGTAAITRAPGNPQSLDYPGPPISIPFCSYPDLS